MIQKQEETVFNLLDIIKSKINAYLLKGMEYATELDFTEMSDLVEKLNSMNLNLISKSTETFLQSLKKLQNDDGKETKMEASINALKLITTLRVFETIVNIELVKSKLM